MLTKVHFIDKNVHLKGFVSYFSLHLFHQKLKTSHGKLRYSFGHVFNINAFL